MAAAVGSALLALGCTVGPDYVRPTAQTPPAFKETEGWKVAQPRDNLPRAGWWQVFGDPMLSDLVAQVDINNQNIKVAEANLRQARALTAQAQSAFFPTVSGNASATRGAASGSGRTVGSNSGTGVVANVYNVQLDATWELDLWGRVRRNVESSEASQQASAADLESAKLSAQAQVATDYLLLRVQDAVIELLQNTADAYEKSLQLTKNQYAVGVAGRSDVVLAEAQLKSTQAQAIDARVQRAQLEHAIAVLIGKPPSEFSIKPAPLSTRSRVSEPGRVGLRRRRPSGWSSAPARRRPVRRSRASSSRGCRCSRP